MEHVIRKIKHSERSPSSKSIRNWPIETVIFKIEMHKATNVEQPERDGGVNEVELEIE